MSKLGIIAIGYNRAESMERLLKALARAEYGEDRPLLLISIDYSGSDKVTEIAQKYEWIYGEKVLKIQKERLGLREHVLKCGSYMKEFELDAVAVFEDDVVPSPAFYCFMKQAVEFYRFDVNVAGISLYTHLINVNTRFPFQPAYGEGDVFFLQFAQSWGQIWMCKQWEEFVEWYERLPEGKCPEEGVPRNIIEWPSTSWLKYHISYCVQRHKYFVYPYIAFSTCYTDVGQHSSHHTTLFQVPMNYNTTQCFRFTKLENALVKYDCFFEREEMGKYLGVNDKDLCVDLYGSKEKIEQRYILTTKKYPYFRTKSFALELRPHELNICYDEIGNDIILYDTDQMGLNSKQKKNVDEIDYYFRTEISGSRIAKYIIEKKMRELFRDKGEK